MENHIFGVAQLDFYVGYMARRQKMLHTLGLNYSID